MTMQDWRGNTYPEETLEVMCGNGCGQPAVRNPCRAEGNENRTHWHGEVHVGNNRTKVLCRPCAKAIHFGGKPQWNVHQTAIRNEMKQGWAEFDDYKTWSLIAETLGYRTESTASTDSGPQPDDCYATVLAFDANDEEVGAWFPAYEEHDDHPASGVLCESASAFTQWAHKDDTPFTP